MCLECSGRHRALGVHISFVRSVAMDSWTEKQIKIMRTGGNDKFNSFLRQYKVEKNTQIPKKYASPAASLFKDRLLAEVEGRPLPTELPKESSASSIHGSSEPLEGESEADYVARQRRLQEEARERMRQKFGSSSGLKSGGSMQGIGSDSRQGGGGGGGVNVNEVTAQLADASQKALSFMSASFSALGEQVSKTVAAEPTSKSNQQTTTDESKAAAAAAPIIAPETIDAYKQHISLGWSALSTQAVGLWAKATEVVQAITEPVDEEAESKFPRGTYQHKEDHNSNTNATDASSNNLPSSQSKSNSFYHQGSGNTNNSVGVGAVETEEVPLKAIAPMAINRSASTSSVGSNGSVNSSSDAPKKNKQTALKQPPAPVGDDFFSTFGV